MCYTTEGLSNEKSGSYIVFEDGWEEGIEGMIQLSNKFETFEEAKNYADSWKDKNTYITKLVE